MVQKATLGAEKSGANMNDFEGWNKILLECKEVNRMKRLNQELDDLLGRPLLYVLEYAEKNSIRLQTETITQNG